jgi:hypothetical protein
MIISSFSDTEKLIQLGNNKIKLLISTIIIEKYNLTDVYYKIIIKNKILPVQHNISYNNNNNNNFENDAFEDKLLEKYLLIKNPLIIYKNLISETIINYLNLYDDELHYYCNDVLKLRKLLLIFLYYLNDNSIVDNTNNNILNNSDNNIFNNSDNNILNNSNNNILNNKTSLK